MKMLPNQPVGGYERWGVIRRKQTRRRGAGGGGRPGTARGKPRETVGRKAMGTTANLKRGSPFEVDGTPSTKMLC